MIWFSVQCGVVVSDESGEQEPEGCAESACEKNVNGTGAHGECSGLQVVKMISIHADGAQECSECVDVDAVVKGAVCACVNRVGLTLCATVAVMLEDRGVKHCDDSGLRIRD